MWELFKLLFTMIGALLIFILGLLAWRQQLIDKRRFEVAEEVMVMYAKLVAQVRILRQPNGYDGRFEWIKEQMGDSEPSDSDYRYEYFMTARKWQYRIPDDKLAAFNEVHKDFTATSELARMYLSVDIVEGLVRIEHIFKRVQIAAGVLARISPEPSIDPKNQSTEQSEYYVPPWPYNPDHEPSNEYAIEKEKEHFPVRFSDPTSPDAIDIEIDTVEAELRKACIPYTDQGPYQFLDRFIATLTPHRVYLWWREPK